MRPFWLRLTALLVLSMASTVHAQSAPRWVFVRDVLPMPEEPITGVWNMVVTSSGRLYVHDMRGQRFWAYDSAGRLIGPIGREGKGPGEFVTIFTYGMVADTFWVSDPNMRRTTFFSPTGKVVGVPRLDWVSLRGERTGNTVSLVAVFGDGLAMVAAPIQERIDNAIVQTRTRYVLVHRASLETNRETDVVESVAVVVGGHGALNMPGPGGRFLQFANQPWSDGDLSALSSSGLLVHVVRVPKEGNHPTYRITVHGEHGVIWSRDIPYAAEPVTDAMAESEFKRFLAADTMTLKQWGSESAVRHAYFDSLFRPKHMPAVTAVLIGNDTTVWVRRADKNSSASVATWDIFDAKGRQVATTQLPATLKVMVVSKSTIWGTDLDSEANMLIVRYQRGNR